MGGEIFETHLDWIKEKLLNIMGANLVKLYTHLEEKLGKETAKVLVEAIEELTEEKRNSLKFELKEELLKEVATKEDIKLLLQKIQTLDEKMEGKLQTLEERINGKIQTLEERMDKKLQALRTEIQTVKGELLKWLIVLFVGQATFIVGLVFTLVKLLK